MRTVHQGKKRTDNEKRKRDVTDNEARKEGLLAGLYSETFGEQVRSNRQVEFKSPAEYIAVARKAHKQLTSEEFMQATGLSVFKLITEQS